MQQLLFLVQAELAQQILFLAHQLRVVAVVAMKLVAQLVQCLPVEG
jgi:hypothetical protein